MAIVLFDNAERKKLYPFTQTRAVAEMRIGIFTQKDRWQRVSGENVCIVTENYLQCLYEKYPDELNLWIDASVIPTDELLDKILSFQDGFALADEKGFVAGRIKMNNENFSLLTILEKFETIYDIENVKRLEYPWQMFQWNDEMIRKDFALITKDKISQKISATNKTISPENIFLEDGAVVEFATLNASTGPIYIDKNATIMEGCFIRGPFSLGENSVLKMGTKIYGAATLGSNCMGGGEIKNSIMHSFSNKAHDGYLGDSVIGSWCNLGAGTSNSNIKNTAADIIMKDFFSNENINAGNKCGVLMGDYSRAAINSSLNTGTVVGVCCNVFGEGLLQRIIDDFSWGTKMKYEFDKAIRDIDNWKKLKHQSINENEISILKYIFDNTSTTTKS
jgi:UDP-N-acetylglucosamine diphosphorylase/glucosamine-1-phosphate N-acetyltransferase